MLRVGKFNWAKAAAEQLARVIAAIHCRIIPSIFLFYAKIRNKLNIKAQVME